jgi:hypothetical protein
MSNPNVLNNPRRVAVLAASGLLALAFTGEARPKGLETHKRDPLLIHTDKKLNSLAIKMETLVQKHDSMSYRDVVEVQGHRTERLVVSHRSKDLMTGKDAYVQVVLYKKIGQARVDSAALIVGAPTARFHLGEKFDSISSIIINNKSPDDYLFWDYSESNGARTNSYYWKNGLQNSYWTDNNPHVPISEKKIESVFDGFTTTLAKIGEVGSSTISSGPTA